MDICLHSRGIFVVKVMGYLSPKSWDICQQTCFVVHVITERSNALANARRYPGQQPPQLVYILDPVCKIVPRGAIYIPRKI